MGLELLVCLMFNMKPGRRPCSLFLRNRCIALYLAYAMNIR